MSFLQTLWGGTPRHVPIWIMRQAGRYLPEYRRIKERSSFLEMTRDPAIAAEVTLQPLRRFPLDAAIIFSDIMTPLEALGLEIEFTPGPSIAHPLRSREAIDALRLREPIAPFVGEAIRLVRAELASSDVALIGFAGAPLTLAAYLVEGSGSKEYQHFRQFLRADPESMHRLLEKLTNVCIAYLWTQVECGAQAIQLFDTGAGLHDLDVYLEFAMPYNKRILEALSESGAARIFFALGASHLFDPIAELPAEAISVDWRTDMRSARRKVGSRTLQGNLDPAVLFTNPATIANEARRTLENAAGGPHIFNLGHGIWPATPLDSVAHLVETVHTWKQT